MRVSSPALLCLGNIAVLSAVGAAGEADHIELVRTFGDVSFRHAASISNVTPLPGGRLFTCSLDGSARVWDLESGAELRRFSRPSNSLWNATVLPGRKHAATTGGGMVTFWDLESGEKLRSFEQGENGYPVGGIPGTKLFASVHDDSVVRIRNWETGEEIQKFVYGEAKHAVWSAIVPDGKHVIVAGNGPIELREIASGKLLKKLERDGRFCVTGVGREGPVRIWDTGSGVAHRVIASKVSPRSYHPFPDADILVATDGHENLYAWFAPVAALPPGADAEIARQVVALASDVFAEREGAARKLFELGPEAIRKLEKLEPSDPEVRLQLAQIVGRLRSQPCGALAAAADLGAGVCGFDAHPDGVHWAAVTGGGHTSTIHLGSCDRETGTLAVFETIPAPNGARSVRFSADGKLLLTGNRTASLGLYRVRMPAPDASPSFLLSD